MSETLGGRFDRLQNRTSGFDYLRLSLALAVIFWHGSVVVYGHEYDKALGQTMFGAAFKLILPMFFALSGFLVAGSLIRTDSLSSYVSFRVLRIFPALCVEVTLSAFLLGAAVTTLPVVNYYTEGEFLRYLGNAFGIVYVYLPGVFKENPSSWVNISLWTVPYELECYLVLLGLAIFGILKRRYLFVIAFVISQVFFPLLDYLSPDQFSDQITRVLPRTLIICFIAGVGLYVFRYRIPNNTLLAAFCLAVSFYLVSSAPSYWMVSLISLPIAYATAVIGLSNPTKLPYVFSGDYSYGLYLYAFPFQQLQMYLFPTNTSWLLNMAFAIPATSVFAVLSWRLIEKPILSKRREITGRAISIVLGTHGSR